MAEGGRDTIRHARRRFQDTMRGDLVAVVAHETGRKVIAFMSDHHLDPDYAVEFLRLPDPFAGCQQVAVGTVDHIVDRIVVLQFAETKADRSLARSEISKAPPGVLETDVRDRAQELVAAEPNHEIVGPHVEAKQGRHLAKQVVAGAVALFVVDRLEPIHIDVDGHEAHLLSPRTLHLMLQLLKPDPASPHACQLVHPGVIAIVSGLCPVTGGLLPVKRRPLAVARRPRPIGGCTVAGRPRMRAKILDSKRVPVVEVLLVVECGRVLVTALSQLVVQRGEFVASLGSRVPLMPNYIS